MRSQTSGQSEEFKPYAAKNVASTLFPHCIVAREAFEGFVVVYERPAMPHLGHIGVGVWALWHHKAVMSGPRPTILRDENTSLQSALVRIKKAMLNHGATAEAVDCIRAIEPFTEEELDIMAAKLAKKDTGAAAKSTAKGGAKKGGNPEALKKAREARASAAQENRKYKHTAKLKDIALREGTWTARMVEIIMGNNTTDDAKAELAKDKNFSDKKLDFTWAEKKGYIAF